MEGFDEQVDGFGKKEEEAEEEEEEDDFQPSATVVASPSNPSLRSRTLRKVEAEEEEKVVAKLKDKQPTNSIFSKLCELLLFAFKFLVFLVILGAGFLTYTTTISSTSEVRLKCILTSFFPAGRNLRPQNILENAIRLFFIRREMIFPCPLLQRRIWCRAGF